MLVSVLCLLTLLLSTLPGHARVEPLQASPEATELPAGKGTLLPSEPARQPLTTETAVPVVLATPLADGSIIHVVQAGQAMWSIATAYNVPLADLYALNGMDENSVIFPGDKILVRRAQTTLTPSFGTGTPQPGLTPSLTPTATVRPTRTLRAASATAALPNPTPAATIQSAGELPPSGADAGDGGDLLLAVIVVLFVLGGILVAGGNLARTRRRG